MKNSFLLQAFEGKNQVVPVWFMRQAGRSLPQYRKIREKYPLQEMFQTPELASEITCLPVDILKVDAAILFADILTLPAQMGFEIEFDNHHGPQIKNSLRSENDLKEIRPFKDLAYLGQAIRLTRQKLPANIALIGFAGSPFTVLSYLIEGQSPQSFSKTFKLMGENPKLFHQAMEMLTQSTIAYLNFQKKEGIQVFQLFDSCSGVLPPASFAHWVLPYVQKIFKAVDLPSIYYVRNCHHLLTLMDRTDADFLSVCHTVVLGHQTTIERTKKGIQGNLFNGTLYADNRTLEREVRDVLAGGTKHKRYIFNLSHGVLPDTDVDKLKFVVEKVHGFKLSK